MLTIKPLPLSIGSGAANTLGHVMRAQADRMKGMPERDRHLPERMQIPLRQSTRRQLIPLRSRHHIFAQHVTSHPLRADAIEHCLHLPVVSVIAPRRQPCPPRASISSMVRPSEPLGSSAPSRLRPVTYTVAPASPSPSAIPFPTPRLAPVTTATRPSSAPHPSSLRQRGVLHRNSFAPSSQRLVPRRAHSERSSQSRTARIARGALRRASSCAEIRPAAKSRSSSQSE